MLRTDIDMTLTDLVGGAQSGSRACWDAIVDRMDNMVWSVVRSYRMSDEDSHDAAQMIWLRVVEKLDNVEDPERLGLWIATTARRECNRLIDKKRRMVPTDPEVGFTRLRAKGDIEQAHLDRATVQQLLDGLSTLSTDCQSLLRLVLADPPMSYAEISASRGIAVGTIGPRRKRCLVQLRAAARL